MDPRAGVFAQRRALSPLRGVSRHQDRLGPGQRADCRSSIEAGRGPSSARWARTSVRLAHYQHSPVFRRRCATARGLVVWAEIPYHLRDEPPPPARPGELPPSQLQETARAEPPSSRPSAVWGLSNEITIGGDPGDVYDTHVLLNDLAHRLDPTRLTAVACLSTCPPDAPYVHLPDLVAYNHYFGWYGGKPEQNGPWFDRFHARYPQTPIGCSEYGCEGLDWRASDPVPGGLHGGVPSPVPRIAHPAVLLPALSLVHLCLEYVRLRRRRPERGRRERAESQGPCIHWSRCYKKDAFYAHQAWLSDEALRPSVRQALSGPGRGGDPGRRSTPTSPPFRSMPTASCCSSSGLRPHFFYFDVPNEGETVLIATAGSCRDESRLRRVAEFPAALPAAGRTASSTGSRSPPRRAA